MSTSVQASVLSSNAATKVKPSKLPKEQLEQMYRTMLTIRRVEESLLELAESGKIGGAMHTAIGHEGNAVGSAAALRPTDYLTSTYRGHHHSLARGMDIKKAIAEVLGKALCRSRLESDGRKRDRRGAGSSRRGYGVGIEDSWRRPHCHYFLWRRRNLPGCHARDL